VPLSLSTLADQVGGCCAVLAPLIWRIERHVSETCAASLRPPLAPPLEVVKRENQVDDTSQAILICATDAPAVSAAAAHRELRYYRRPLDRERADIGPPFGATTYTLDQRPTCRRGRVGQLLGFGL
jgi:hypothetical protein